MSDVRLTAEERRLLHEGVYSRHRDTTPGVYVCRPCETAGDSAVEAIVAARLLPLTDLLARAEAGADAWGTCGGEWLRIADLRAAATAVLAAQPPTTERTP